MRGFFLAASSLLLSATPAGAHHFNRGHFVPAFASCLAPLADTTTSEGVPACSPVELLSDCEVTPATSVRLGERAKSSFNMEPKGRRRTRANEGYVDMDSRFALTAVQTCDGEPFDGTLEVQIVMRIQRDDPACNSGHCTLPDVSYTVDLPCSRGKCRATAGANDALVAQGLAPLPSEHNYRILVVGTSILDPAGRRFLDAGVSISGEVAEHATPPSLATWLKRLLGRLAVQDAHAYGSTGVGAARRNTARLVHAFRRCDPLATDTLTGDGVAACTTRLLSDCVLDAQAVVPFIPENGNFTDKGKGKLDFSVLGDAGDLLLRVRGWLEGLRGCNGQPYSGPVGVRAIARASLIDPTCTTGRCTTVDTTLFDGTVEAMDGDVDKRSFDAMQLAFEPASTATGTLNAALVEVQLLDPSGNPFMFGPAWLVRCNYASETPNFPGGDAFCFGN